MSSATKRACDACHRRKVRCDGLNPCYNCRQASLRCTYNAIPQKKGPKGSRAKVISELRATQLATSLSAQVQNRLNGMASPPCPPSLSPNAALLSNEVIKACIDFFFANLYDITPILCRPHIERDVMSMDQAGNHCLVTSLCAFVLLQPGMTMPGNDPLWEHPGAILTASQLLLEEALRVRKGYDYTVSPTLTTMCTSYFIYCCYYAVSMHEKAWFHLREAATLAHISGITQEENFSSYVDSVESSRLRRLYWLILVAERSYALKYNRPLSLPAGINPPSLSDDPTDPLAHQINSFVHLVNLFRPLDDAFMLLWNKTRNEWPSGLQHSSQFMNGVDAHEMRTNQQWLKTMAWHLTGSAPSADDMAYQYPLDVSRDVMGLTAQFQTPAADIHGVPLVGKLLEMANGMADVLSMQPSSSDPFGIGPQQHLQQLHELVSMLRSGHYHLLPQLRDKVHEVLPRLANPMLQRVPDDLCNIDIFDGFGNAGMAQPPVMTDYKAEQFKTEPYTPQNQQHMSRMDDLATDSGSPSNGAAPAEMRHSPFANMNVSSPQVVSPGMDYDHSGHQQQSHLGDFNSIPNLVMNSMGQPSNSQPSQHTQQQQQQQQQQPPPQQQPPQQVPGFQAPQGLAQSTHSMHAGQMPNPNDIHGQMSHGLNQNSMGHPPTSGPPSAAGHTQPYNHMMMSSILNRQQPPARQNSFSMQPQPPSRLTTIGDFHSLQRNNSDNVSTISSLNLNQMPTQMDFSGGMR